MGPTELSGVAWTTGTLRCPAELHPGQRLPTDPWCSRFQCGALVQAPALPPPQSSWQWTSPSFCVPQGETGSNARKTAHWRAEIGGG